MRDLFLWTFNCGKSQVNADELKTLIGAAFNKPHLAVFAFQEICPIMDACLGNQSEYLQIIESSIEDAIGFDYSKVDVVVIGAVALLVYIATPAAAVATHATAIVRNGMLYSSLKGAASVRIQLSENSEEYTFVAAHLAAGEGKSHLRNQDYHNLVTRLDFGDGHGAYKPGSRLFVLGDLNYRALSNPFVHPPSLGSSGEEEHESVELTSGSSGYNQQHLQQTTGLLTHHDGQTRDELLLEMQGGNSRVFVGMSEAEITFRPTYKLVVGSSEIYNTKRIPSWCDRVLFQHQNSDDEYVIQAYKSLPATSSDHHPVYLSLSVSESFGEDESEVDVFPGLDDNRMMYAVCGEVSDKAIGWGLVLTTTKTGYACMLSGAALLYVAYLFF